MSSNTEQALVIARAKTKRLLAELTDRAKAEAARTLSNFQLHGALLSSKCLLGIGQVAESTAKELVDKVIAIYVETVGGNLLRDITATAIARVVDEFYSEFKSRHQSLFTGLMGYGSKMLCNLDEKIAALKASIPEGLDVALFDATHNSASYTETTLKDIHADIRNLEQIASPLPGAVAKIERGVNAVRLNTEAIAKNEYELRQENAELQALTEGGFLRFATRVDADDFRAFAAVMLTGNRNQAAQALTIPQRTFYDLVDSWPTRGADYKRMYRMAEWRKKVGRKIKVRLDDSLLGTEVKDQTENPEVIRDVLAAMRDKTDTKNRDDLLRDILEAIASQNAKNWQDIRAEVIEILREEVSQ